MRVSKREGMEGKRSYGDNEKGRNAETDEGTERESGMDRQERSSQNVRKKGGVVKIKGKMKTERVCLAGEIDKEWS